MSAPKRPNASRHRKLSPRTPQPCCAFANPASVYVTVQQQAIRTLNVAMPVLGWLAVLSTVSAAVLARGNRRRLTLFGMACVGLIGAGLVTRFLNQPINAIVMTWSADALPPNWTEFRDAWWRWHVLRTVWGIAGLSLVIFANLGSDRQKVVTR